ERCRSLLSVYVSIALSASPYYNLQAQDLTLPTGGSVASGQATIVESASKLQINQATQQAIINWKTFNIGTNATVNFTQPNASALAVNRVTGGSPTKILGNLTANGRVMLINSAGMYFSKTAKIDVGTLVASTGKIADQNLIDNNFAFDFDSDSGTIVNEGTIRADQVAMLSPNITNQGTISSSVGDTVLASGQRITVNLNNSDRIGVAISETDLNTLIENQGAIESAGTITIKASAMQSLVDKTINTPGSANQLVADNGVIRLVSSTGSLKAKQVIVDAGDNGAAYVNGSIDVSNANGQGGQIEVTGQAVTLDSTANLDASGATGGGKILVGGDWQGSGETRQAITTTIKSGATLNASATEMGDGGT
ncbi:MAG: filamentous hemagglutinin N-terminal domain-containing protein, partial [Burkholderiales bacterium]|nr:filamentous hemagglutinin N-terminal domain-containing protein [Burkholderiales bacterium]